MTEAVPVIIRGETFPSMSAAARHFGISHQAVFDAVERGCTDGVGLGDRWWRKRAAQPRSGPPDGLDASPGTPRRQTQQEATE